jgi:hypothetical protein
MLSEMIELGSIGSDGFNHGLCEYRNEPTGDKKKTFHDL